MSEKVEVENIEATNVGHGDAETPENTVSLKKFKSVWAERQSFKDAVAEREAELENYKSKLENVNSQLNEYKGYKEKLDKWESDRLGERQSKWNEKAKVLEAQEGDKNYDKVQKVKEKFLIGTDKEPLTNEQLDKNFELMNIYEETNYFEVEKVDSKKLNVIKPSVDNANAVGDGKYYGYKTPEALSSADWRLAEKWKASHGGKW